MTKAIKGGCGDYYVQHSKKDNRTSFFIKYLRNSQGISVGNIYFPENFIGKRVRLKFEFVEGKDGRRNGKKV